MIKVHNIKCLSRVHIACNSRMKRNKYYLFNSNSDNPIWIERIRGDDLYDLLIMSLHEYNLLAHFLWVSKFLSSFFCSIFFFSKNDQCLFPRCLSKKMWSLVHHLEAMIMISRWFTKQTWGRTSHHLHWPVATFQTHQCMNMPQTWHIMISQLQLSTLY